MNEDELNKISARGVRAQNLLENELLDQAYEGIEKSLIEAWIVTDPRDDDGRKMCWFAVQANRKHKIALQKFVSDGKIAQADLKQIFETAERKKRFGLL